MAVSAGCADRGAVESALAAISRLGAMIEAQRLHVRGVRALWLEHRLLTWPVLDGPTYARAAT